MIWKLCRECQNHVCGAENFLWSESGTTEASKKYDRKHLKCHVIGNCLQSAGLMKWKMFWKDEEFLSLWRSIAKRNARFVRHILKYEQQESIAEERITLEAHEDWRTWSRFFCTQVVESVQRWRSQLAGLRTTAKNKEEDSRLDAYCFSVTYKNIKSLIFQALTTHKI